MNDDTQPIALRTILGLLLIVGWILLVVGGYYLIHKPIDQAQLTGLARVVLQFACAFGVTVAAGGVGRRFLRLAQFSTADLLVLQASLGIGTLGISWLVIGLLGGYHPLVAYGVLLGLLILLRREVIAWWQDLLDVSGQVWGRSSWLGKVFWGLGGFFVLSRALFALAGITKWDALMYHLELVRRYIDLGRFTWIEANFYWGNPPLGEMIYTWGSLLAGYETAAVLGWFVGLLWLGGIASIVFTRWDADSAGLAVLAVLVGTSLRGLLSWAYIDGFAGMYGACALIVGLRLLESGGKNKDYVYLGIFAGLALWSKLTAGILLPAIGMGLLFATPFTAWAGRIRQFLVVGFSATLVFLPWLLINFTYTGSPIYPHLLPVGPITEARQAYFSYDPSLHWDGLYLPLAMTWYGLEQQVIGGGANYSSDIGLLLVLLAVPGFWLGIRQARTRLLLGWIAAGWLGMVIGGAFADLLWQTRLFVALIPAAAVGAGLGWHSIRELRLVGVRIERLMLVVILLAAGLAVNVQLEELARTQPLPIVLGLEPQEDYLRRTLGGDYVDAMQAVKDLPHDTRTVFLWEPRGFYAPLTASADIYIDRWYFEGYPLGSEGYTDALQDAGFTHVLVYTRGMEFELEHRQLLQGEAEETLATWLASLEHVNTFENAYQMFRIP